MAGGWMHTPHKGVARGGKGGNSPPPEIFLVTTSQKTKMLTL